MCSEMRHCNLLQFHYRYVCNTLVDKDRSATDKRYSFLERNFHEVMWLCSLRQPVYRMLIIALVFLKCYLILEIFPDLICRLQLLIVDPQL